jgi:hypothetical protein
MIMVMAEVMIDSLIGGSCAGFSKQRARTMSARETKRFIFFNRFLS